MRLICALRDLRRVVVADSRCLLFFIIKYGDWLPAPPIMMILSGCMIVFASSLKFFSMSVIHCHLLKQTCILSVSIKASKTLHSSTFTVSRFAIVLMSLNQRMPLKRNTLCLCSPAEDEHIVIDNSYHGCDRQQC